MKFFTSGRVKCRFRTDTGLLATVKADEQCRVEVIVEGEQIFGRCSCSPESGTMCRHQVAVALAFLEQPATFTTHQRLRKAIRKAEKAELVEILLNLTNVHPEIAGFFDADGEKSEVERLKRQIADIFDVQPGGRWSVSDVTVPAMIVLQRARMLRNAGRWDDARAVCFELLDKALGLDDRKHGAAGYPESFLSALADGYEGSAMDDPEIELKREKILAEIEALGRHDSAETEGVYMDQLMERLGAD
jgi:hypothetical protein